MTKKTLKNSLINIVPYIVTLGIVLIFQILVIHLNSYDLSMPLFYRGDDMATTLYRTFEMRTDFSFFGFNQLGSPNGSNTLDFYVFDILLYLIQFIFAVLAPSTAWGFNLFVIGGAWFNSVFCLYTLRRLKYGTPLSVSLSVLYGLLPFYFIRLIGHTYLTYYFTAPLAILAAIEIYKDEFVIFDFKSRKSESVRNIIFLLMMGTTGVYFAVFACMFMLIAGLLRATEDRSFKKILPAVKSIGVTVTGFILAASPSLIYWAINGMPKYVGSRSDERYVGETYSLKLTEMLLPNWNHRIPAFRAFRRFYGSFFPVNETVSSALGIIFSIGLIAILFYTFKLLSSPKKSTMRAVTIIMLITLLIATRGGVSAFLVMLLPFVRCYNRIIVYIAFMCAIAVAEMVTFVLAYISKKISSKAAVTIIALVVSFGILGVGIYDQATIDTLYVEDMNAVYIEDEAMVKYIVDYSHELDPDDEFVDCFFMPFMDFPENSQDVSFFLMGYEPMLLVTHDEDLCVSYGAQEGRPLSNEFLEVENSPILNRADYAMEKGYDGIIIAHHAMNLINREDFLALCDYLGTPDYQTTYYSYWSLENQKH